MSKFTRWFDKQPSETQQYLNRIPIWTQREMLSALFAGFVIGVVVGAIF